MVDHMDVAGPRKGSKVWVVGLVVLVVAAAGAMGWFAYSSLRKRPVPIGEITADLRTYDNTTVTVKGTVDAPTNLMVAKFFTLRDDSGEIVVVTQRGLPSAGAEVEVTGQVQQLFEIAGMQQTVIMESAANVE
jgi:hypothetical protein